MMHGNSFIVFDRDAPLHFPACSLQLQTCPCAGALSLFLFFRTAIPRPLNRRTGRPHKNIDHIQSKKHGITGADPAADVCNDPYGKKQKCRRRQNRRRQSDFSILIHFSPRPIMNAPLFAHIPAAFSQPLRQYLRSSMRYCTASPTASASMLSLPARSAMVRAVFSRRS